MLSRAVERDHNTKGCLGVAQSPRKQGKLPYLWIRAASDIMKLWVKGGVRVKEVSSCPVGLYVPGRTGVEQMVNSTVTTILLHR